MSDDPSDSSRSDPRTGNWQPGKTMTDIPGDPGVGGLVADPEERVSGPKTAKKPAGAPSADPPQPAAHGDWAPNRPWRGQAGDDD